MSMKTIMALWLTASLLLSAQTLASTPAVPVETLLARLEAQIPSEPSSPTPDIVRLINEVGATKRLDAAFLLARALAFGFSPIGQGESKSAFSLMPAAQALKENYGAHALPVLMFAGVTAKEGWLQTRIALTIRGIGSAEEVLRLRSAFSTDETRDPIARQFAARLTQPEVSLADDPVFKQFDDLRRFSEELLKKQQDSKGVKPPQGTPKTDDKPKPPVSN
jgi:hypothetical protein